MDIKEYLKPLKRTPPIEIGSRHTHEHRIFHDQASGDYQEMNPIPLGHMALLQYALCPDLLSKKPISKSRRSLPSAPHVQDDK
jgi:hypothetical protein